MMGSMIQTVIITLAYREQEFDMELPAHTAVSQLKTVLAKALTYRGLHLPADFGLEEKGVLLKDTDTLYESGIWDGSCLNIVSGGRHYGICL